MKNEYKERKVLVTGGAGFIGSHLVEMLIDRGANVVTAVDSLCTGRLSNLAAVRDQTELMKLDLTSDDLRPVLKKGSFDTIFHLAANANVNKSVEDPGMDLRKNVLGTFNLLEAVREVSPQSRIVFTSSATVYGEGVHTPINEDDPKIPESPYGVSKLACEHYIRIYATLYSLRTATARMFSVYGPRLRKQVLYDLMCKLNKNPNELFIHGDGTQVRDMNHVFNVAEAILLIARKAKLQGESYNVASGDQVSIRQLAEMLCHAMGLKPKFVFSGQVRAGETQKWFPDYSRLLALGYQNQVSLVGGLANTVEWFRREIAEGELG